MKKHTTILLLLAGSLLSAQVSLTPAQLDSLRQVAATAKDDIVRIDALVWIGEAVKFTQPDSTAWYLNESLRLARGARNQDKLLGCLVILGYFYGERGEPAKAVDLLHEALLIVESIEGSDQSMVTAFLANNYEAQGDLENAVLYARKSYLEYERLRAANYPVHEMGYPAGPMRMGQIFEKTGQLDSALHYARMAQARITEKPLDDGMVFFYCQIFNLLGTVCLRQNEPAAALGHFQDAMNRAVEANYSAGITEGQFGMALFFEKMGPPDSLAHYAGKAYDGGKVMKDFEIMERSAAMLRRLYERQGRYAEALRYNDLAIAARDSVSGAEKVREVQRLTHREELRQQKIQQEAAAAEVAFRNKIRLWSVLAVLGGALLLAFILFRNNRQKQRANALLKSQKEEIETQKIQLQTSLETLKATQAQLIQSEKLASLGELTAGIAHEIQNPLNFVNNFSELSVDLAKELKEEMDKVEMPEKDKAYISEILTDLGQNQQKINHHGKRAASIVTGMLQHSRTSTGKKEPTDLNALADEYLRLSYHGLRAKDVSFNAKIITNFDPEIGKVEVIPQDMGRVLLNLVNNAFYAVNQRKLNVGGVLNPSDVGDYEPTVAVSSKKLDSGMVEICIKDNGTGIPDSLKAKIFQPFFTTKPTGQGTGLGLSLAYDIVTKGHGGTMEVESAEGEGTEFVIQLPI